MKNSRLTDAELFAKYRGGLTPPLVCENDDKMGLVSAHLMDIYQLGVCGLHSISMCLLVPPTGVSDPKKKWQMASFRGNPTPGNQWRAACRLIRTANRNNTYPGDVACETCHRTAALCAELAGQAIAYLCCHGLIDIAVPVGVEGHVVAVFLSGQLRPREGEDWPHNLVQVWDPRPAALASKLDLYSLSRERLRQTECYGILPQAVDMALGEDSMLGAKAVVGPKEVRQMLHLLDAEAALLSDIATKTFQVEFLRLSGTLRVAFAGSLANLESDLSNWAKAVDSQKRALESFTKITGGSYAFLCKCSQQGCHLTNVEQIAAATLDDEEASQQKNDLGQIDLNQHKKIILSDFQGIAYRLRTDLCQNIKFQKRSPNQGQPPPEESCIALFPQTTPGYFVVLGLKDAPEHLQAVRIQEIGEIACLATLVAETLWLLRDANAVRSGMDCFIEDLAHDIRAPIQAIITKTAMLKRCALNPNEYQKQASRLAAAVMRIDLLARRVWLVQRIHRGNLQYADGKTASALETVAKVFDVLADIVARKNVEVVQDMDSLSAMDRLPVDPDMFYETVLNLVHNAVKYSSTPVGARKPQVIIKGFQTEDLTKISVGNRGIEVRPDERRRIFERYFRTQEAVQHDPEGTGIGLSIVREFCNHYDATIEVASDPIKGSQDFLTIFEITFKRRRN